MIDFMKFKMVKRSGDIIGVCLSNALLSFKNGPVVLALGYPFFPSEKNPVPNGSEQLF